MKLFNKRWQVVAEINKGGQGIVYKVKDKTTEKYYALKLIHFKKFQKQRLKRAKNEIEIIKKLKNSANIVKIYDDNLQEVIDEKSQDLFYVMDFSSHGSLKDNDFFLNDVETSLVIFREILKGVGSAHKEKIIHRDLKPENILLYPTQKDVMISDFGIGMIKEKQSEEQITEEGEILGPMHFISPEQFKDPSNADEKSDIYSLGKILLFMLTGKGKIFREEVEDLSTLFKGENPYLPLIQENLLSKMIVEDADKRFQNVEEIIDEVNYILDKLSENSKRYLKKAEKGPRIYNLFIGSQRQQFIKEFADDLVFSLKILEWGIIDLNKEKKKSTADGLISELKKIYPDEKYIVSISAVELFVNNPKKLKELEKEKPASSFPPFFLYKYFYDTKSLSIAHGYLEKALSLEKDPEITLSYLLNFSDVCKECKCELKHDFEARMKKLLRSTVDMEKKSALYRMLGEHFIETGNIQRGLIFLEAYLNEEPFDETIRFTCAFQYSKIKEYQSSLYHYLIAYKNSKDKEGVANNLGVLYTENQMPIKGMEMYEKSSSLGSTLAGSNIASKLLSIGLKEKSLKLLRDIIRENKIYDEQVDTILGKVHANVDEEDRKQKELEAEGNLINDYHIEYVKALTNSNNYEWAGFWEINNRYAIEIKADGTKKVIAALQGPSISLEGKFDGDCFNISKLLLNNSTYSTGTSYNEGLLFLKSNNVMKGYVRSGKNSPFELIGNRIMDIENFKKQHASSFDALSAAIALNTGVN